MDVETCPRSMPEKRVSMSARVSTATPARPTSPLAEGVVGVAPEQRRHVEGGRQPVAAGPQQLLEAPVGVLRRAEPGELAHRPQAGAVHGGVGPPGVGVLAGQLGAVGAVDGLERHARHRLEAGRSHAASGRMPPARSARSAIGSILLQCQSTCHPPQLKSPAARRRSASRSKSRRRVASRHAEVREDLLVHRLRRLRRRVCRPDAVSTAKRAPAVVGVRPPRDEAVAPRVGRPRSSRWPR